MWLGIGRRENHARPAVDRKLKKRNSRRNRKREIAEETDIKKVENFKLIAAQDILRTEGKHVVRLTYTADVQDEKITLDVENTEYIWIAPEELKTLNSYLEELVKEGTL